MRVKGDILVEFNINSTDEDYITHLLIHLQDIIDQNEVGEFEYGPFKISINKKRTNQKIKYLLQIQQSKKNIFIKPINTPHPMSLYIYYNKHDKTKEPHGKFEAIDLEDAILVASQY